MNKIRRVLVIGSGPIVIGQAAEFDYAGTQACLAIREEGFEVVLVNSNPATIMTDEGVADKIYIEPLTKESIIRILERENIDAILPNLGGQTGLNLGVQLYHDGTLQRLGIQLLGTDVEAIENAEDREKFKALMEKLGEPVPASMIVHSVEEALKAAQAIGYPIIVRPAFTLGGSGGGRAVNASQLSEIVKAGLLLSPMNQCLIEQDISGYKEIEYEVIRDKEDTMMVVCTMENFDPVGVHTGDSIVFAPAQTVQDDEIQMLREASFRIMHALGIEGGCNIQYALDPLSSKYYVIEVNPRVSRSSALASKATGYPIAKITSKIAVGRTLNDMDHPLIPGHPASLEPVVDYVVAKLPRWPFDKFQNADRSLSTQMKATGEVMALGRNFEASLMKAVRSLELGVDSLKMESLHNESDEAIQNLIQTPTDLRLFAIYEALSRGVSVDTLYEWTKIDRFFLNKIKHLLELETCEDASLQKFYGYPDSLAHAHNHKPVYKRVDGKGGQVGGVAPYFYSSYEQENESIVSDKEKIIVLGSGPIRIGQGVEFDYATVHCIEALREMNYEAIVINNNPETVSTDYERADKLYFEPLTLEDVMNIVDHEKPLGVIVQFGGQTAINLAEGLQNRGVKILGTRVEDIQRAENREAFSAVLKELGISQAPGAIAHDKQTLIRIANQLGYPVLIRSSYVLGGQMMQLIENEQALLTHVEHVSFEHPVLIDKYIQGIELEVDAICDGKHVRIPGIMEHIERSGVHSGDSMAVIPPQTIPDHILKNIVAITERLALALNTIGTINIQFVLDQETIYVIEANPRASRTVPILSKIAKTNMAQIATQIMCGHKLEAPYGLMNTIQGIHVKAPVFSFAKLRKVDTHLSPEMKSTGEVMGSDTSFDKALYKAFVASGYDIERQGSVILTVADADKAEIVSMAQKLQDFGIPILATTQTANFLNNIGIRAEKVAKLDEGKRNIMDIIRNEEIRFIVNTVSQKGQTMSDGFKIRRASVEHGVPIFTSIDTAQTFLKTLEERSIQPWTLKERL